MNCFSKGSASKYDAPFIVFFGLKGLKDFISIKNVQNVANWIKMRAKKSRENAGRQEFTSLVFLFARDTEKVSGSVSQNRCRRR